jgi:flagellar protein FliL
MAKEKDKASDADETKDGEGAEGAEPKKGFSKKLLLIAGAGGLVLLLAIGGGVYYFFFSGSGDSASKTKLASANGAPLVAPQVVFFDMPDLVVNIQSADGAPAYLKLAVSLELDGADEKPGLQALMPRIVDQFQSYLRELRIDDLRGSAGVMRLKEELLRRINVAAAPFSVRDVLLKEMIVQ